MKRDPIRAALEALAEAARRPSDPAVVELVRASLGHRSNHVVARAAQAAREAGLDGLAPDLADAFFRFLEDPVKRDPTCAAKTAIVQALLAFEHPASEVFLRGVRHVQLEPAFGEPVDTAEELRGTSAMALVVTRYHRALPECLPLLVDPRPLARIGALRALGASGRPDVALTLQLYVLGVEREPDILEEAFTALLSLTPGEAIPFVTEHLASAKEGVAEAAALALGESHLADVLPALRERMGGEGRANVRRSLMLALARLRDDNAFNILLQVLEEGSPADARAALEALRLYPHDEALQRRVRQAIERRDGRSRRSARSRAPRRGRG